MADKKPVSHEQLKALCRMKPTKKDCAAFFEVSEDTIDRRCQEYEGIPFAAFRDKYMVHTRMDLIRKALKQAEKSPAIMIFCLKNLCGWSDKNVDAQDVAQQIMLNYKLDDDGNFNPKPK